MSPAPLLLASLSPRRRAILSALGVTFDTVNPVCDELHDSGAPAATVTENARRKALSVLAQRPDAFIIAADTVVSFAGRALGKPTSLEEARAWLLRYAGRRQQVYTAVAFVVPGQSAPEVFTEVTSVRFADYGEETVDRYLAAVRPLDRAGAYDINEHGDWLIAGWVGSYSNVMGLPKGLVRLWLKAHGIPCYD